MGERFVKSGRDLQVAKKVHGRGTLAISNARSEDPSGPLVRARVLVVLELAALRPNDKVDGSVRVSVCQRWGAEIAQRAQIVIEVLRDPLKEVLALDEDGVGRGAFVLVVVKEAPLFTEQQVGKPVSCKNSNTQASTRVAY